jgi:thiamine biosynthesis lipoprotein
MTPMPTATRRAVHVEHCMGTVFSLDIRDPGEWTHAIADVCSWLHRVDAVFSTYRPDSDISRIRRGELGPQDAHLDVARVLDMCVQFQQQTDGYFSALAGGSLDPTGLVKGWAIECASEKLRALGSANHAVSGGGDMKIAGSAGPDRPWRVGVSDPSDPGRVLAVVTGSDLAIATSGGSERGAHILDPFTGRPATELASVTVVGRSLTSADCFATAAVAMGGAAFSWLEAIPGHEGLVVDATGDVRATRRFPSATNAADG